MVRPPFLFRSPSHLPLADTLYSPSFLAVLAHDPLRVSLADLLSADTKGKWWLVGAAWGGNPLVDHAAAKVATKTITLEAEEDDLMKLARKQGMNTDVRRRVFVVIMSSTVSPPLSSSLTVRRGVRAQS